MDYREALAYVDSLTNYEHAAAPREMRAVRLARMRRLCRRLGDPQRQFRSILVAGTNGKGSICAMLYAMLRESAFSVGLYTSPHLEHVRERIRVWPSGSGAPGGRLHGRDWIGETDFATIVERIRPLAEELRGSPEGAPTYFEMLTAIALVYFSERQADVAVLEVGLGGRLDATNIVEQAVSVIGPVDLDHREVLGEDPAAIAREKAGIIKPGQLAITAPQPDGVMEALRAACDAQGVPLFVCGTDLTAGIQSHGHDGLQVSITGLRGAYESLGLPLIGRHQAHNAVLAIAALEALSNAGVPYPLVERGLAGIEWPGRIEVVSEIPLVIMDGAHNPHAVTALRDTLAELWPGRRFHLLIGMSSDKSPEAVGKILGELAASATCTRSRHPRALDPVELARRLSPFCQDVHVMFDAVDAYTYLLNAMSSHDAILVTGSLFLVGELRAAIRQSHVRSRRAPQLEMVE